MFMEGYYMGSPLLIFGALAVFILVSVGVLLVLWMALPFSVFGMKNLMKKAIEEQEKTNRLLAALIESLDRQSDYRHAQELAEKRENTH